MAKHWSEPLDPKRHRNFFTSAIGGRAVCSDPHSRLRGGRAYFVRAEGFTFQFVSLDQVRECLAWFKQPIHPSSADSTVDFEHYWQRWYERLPKGLTRNPKRERIVAALDAALADFANGTGPSRGT
jgi:hypothetical protein